MAMTDDRDPVERAAALARAERPAGVDWEATAASVMHRIRTTLRPGRRLAVPLPDDRRSATFVNERVVVAALRRALAAVDGVAPSDVRFEIGHDRCLAVELDLVARYGADLQALGAAARDVVGEVLGGLLLDGADAVDVRLRVVDVTEEQ